jgi:ketosteroid isomerase-like protein
MTNTEEANDRLAHEHFAAESAHDTERTLRTLADDVMYRVVAPARRSTARRRSRNITTSGGRRSPT